MDAEVLKSYLVKLGFGVDNQELNRFNLTIEKAGRDIETFTEGSASSFAKMGTAIVAAYATVATATASLMDKVSQAELGYQLFSMRMYMTNEMGKKLKITLDALGYSLEDIGWNPELQRRTIQLFKDQERLQEELGPQYQERMLQLRDLRFEFTRMQVAFQYLGMSVVSNIAQALGLDDNSKVRNWVNWLIDNVPVLATKISNFLVPILKDAWAIFKDLYQIGEALASMFPALWQALGGDPDGRIKQGQSTLEQLAITIDEISRAIRTCIDLIARFKNAIGIGVATGGGAVAGFEIGSLFGPIGSVLGTLIGGGAGFAFGSHHFAQRDKGSGAMSNTDAADHARELAKDVSAKTGVPADWIFAQWAHETNFFRSRAFLEQNNLGGIREGADYRTFNSMDASADYFANLLNSPRYRSAREANSDAGYAMGLKSGGYYEDSFANYYRGLRRWEPSYSQGGGDVHVGTVNVHVTEPHATYDDIHRAAAEAFRDEMGNMAQRQLAEAGNPMR